MLKWTLRIAIALVVGLALVIGGSFFWVWSKKRDYGNLTDTHDLLARTDRLAEKYLAERPNSSLIVAIVQRDRSTIRGYGKTKPDENTEFEIGSITKVFTSLLLAQRVTEGAVKLDDSIENFLPTSQAASWLKTNVVTLKHLATHTSGLPRLPDDLLKRCKDQEDPYADYTEARLLESLANRPPETPPGKKYAYSNFGAGLLGYLLGKQAGATYEELLQREILEPLDLRDTALHPNKDQERRLLPGLSMSGEPVKRWNFDVLAPCGALKSTAADMVKFLKANLSTNDLKLTAAMKLARERHFDSPMAHVGLGWHHLSLIEGPQVTWHNGGTAGFASFVAFDRARGIGIFTCANAGDAMAGNDEMDSLALNIYKLATKVSLEADASLKTNTPTRPLPAHTSSPAAAR